MRLAQPSPLVRWLRTLALVVLAWASAALPTASVARAQHAPADVAVVSRDLVIPAAPEGFVTRERGSVRWEYPARASHLVEPLFETWDGALPRIRRELGIEGPLPPIRLRVGIDPDQMRALAPEGAPPPSYAVGVAYPGLSLILLTLTAPETWQRPDLHGVLVHELSHVALHVALNGEGERENDVPLWLVEGIAIYQARERSIERVQTLWEAAFRGGIIELDELDERFPNRPHSVDLAYAQSADFVAWLLRRSGPEKLGEMIGRVRRGQRFEVAVSQTWSAGIGQLELEWRENLAGRFGALPLFATGGAGWGLVAVLVIAAWRRRRRKSTEIEERWAAEDARQEALERAYARHRARQLARERARALADSAVEPVRELDPETPSEPVEAPADPRRSSTGGPVITTVQSTKPTTGFVVGSTDPARFEDETDRGDQPLH